MSAIITIYPDQTGNTWLARFHDDQAVIEAFGSDLLPTAFTLAMPGAEVRRTIEALNPGARVRLIGLDGTIHED